MNFNSKKEILYLKGAICALQKRIDDLEKAPHCIHPPEKIIEDKKHGFMPRQGCLECNQWLQPVKLNPNEDNYGRPR